MTDNFTVIAYGKDTSGRTIYLTVYAHDLHERVMAECARHGFTPTLIQSSFMTRNGGGADASGHVHDLAGAIDYRTRDLTREQVGILIRAWRRVGGAAYHRTLQNSGMDEHCHVTIGSDRPLHPDTQWSWNEYLAGRNALSGSHAGPDPFWRPDPLVTVPPKVSPPEPVKPTRGPNVDAAIKALRNAKGGKVRMGKIKAALKALLGIRTAGEK